MSVTKGIQIQERDFELLRGLFESRVMTLRHMAAVYFDEHKEAAKKRVQRLKKEGFISERKRRRNEPSVLFLTRAAFVLLAENGELDHYPKFSLNALAKRAQVSALTIEHELTVADVRAAIIAAIQRSTTFSLIEFCTWPLLCEFETAYPHGAFTTTTKTVKPDGFLRINVKDKQGIIAFENTFFLEVDKTTERQGDLALKASYYANHYVTGEFARKSGSDGVESKDYPFRVLMVFESAERRNNTAARLLIDFPKIRTQVWLTTFAEVTRDPLGSIWVQPEDYERAIEGTQYEAQRHTRFNIYRRRPERERTVEARVLKHQFLLPLEQSN